MSCSDYPVLGVFLVYYCRFLPVHSSRHILRVPLCLSCSHSPALAVPQWLFFSGRYVLSCPLSPVLQFFSACPVFTVLLCMSYSNCYVLLVPFCLSHSAFPAVLSLLPCIGCPVLASSACPVLSCLPVILWLSCPWNPALAVLYWQSSPAIRSCQSCLFFLFCSACPLIVSLGIS